MSSVFNLLSVASCTDTSMMCSTCKLLTRDSFCSSNTRDSRPLMFCANRKWCNMCAGRIGEQLSLQSHKQKANCVPTMSCFVLVCAFFWGRCWLCCHHSSFYCIVGPLTAQSQIWCLVFLYSNLLALFNFMSHLCPMRPEMSHFPHHLTTLVDCVAAEVAVRWLSIKLRIDLNDLTVLELYRLYMTEYHWSHAVACRTSFFRPFSRATSSVSICLIPLHTPCFSLIIVIWSLSSQHCNSHVALFSDYFLRFLPWPIPSCCTKGGLWIIASLWSHPFQLQKRSCLPLPQVTPLPYFYHRHCYHLVFQAYLLHPGRPLWPHISAYSCPLCLMALQVTLLIQQVLTDQSRSVWSLETTHSCS